MISEEELEKFKKKDITDKTIIELENILRASISVIANYQDKKKFKSYMLAIRCLQDEIESLNDRIYKALHLITHSDITDYRVFDEELLNILRGEEK